MIMYDVANEPSETSASAKDPQVLSASGALPPAAAVRRALRLDDLSRASAARGRRIVVLGNVSGRRGDRLPQLLDELARLHARAASAARDRGEPPPLP